jgi:hypothetical protein
MTRHVEEEDGIRKFLLGELSPDERGGVEERLFLDREYFEEFRAARDELIDEYLYGDLSADERERFEKYVLPAPEHQESIVIAQALGRYVSGSAPAVSTSAGAAWLSGGGRWWRLAFAAAAALVVALGLWAVLRRPPTPSQPVALEPRRESAPASPQPVEPGAGSPNRNQVASSEAPVGADPTPPPTAAVKRGGMPARPERPAAGVASFLLAPSVASRRVGDERPEEEGEPLRVRPGVGSVELRLPLIEPTAHRRFHVSLQTSEGKMIRRWGPLGMTRRDSLEVVAVTAPVSLLPEGRYRLVLSGVSSDRTLKEISIFRLRVEKPQRE